MGKRKTDPGSYEKGQGSRRNNRKMMSIFKERPLDHNESKQFGAVLSTSKQTYVRNRITGSLRRAQ
jgi:hypothetical protein